MKEYNKYKLNKKSASPMLTTVFLLIFALSLGFVLVNLDTYMPSSKNICQDLYEVKVVNVKGLPWVCQKLNADAENNALKILLANEAEETTVSGLHLTFLGSSENPVHIIRDYDTVIQPAATVAKKYNYPKSIGELQQVKVSVYRKQGSKLELCTKYSIIVDSIPECDEWA